jgi:ABC-type branched-subunit amino acid transport system ATPase component
MSAPAKQVLLDVRGVAKSFGGVRAVDGVDFVVNKGEVVTIIGPNGSGKSTFFNLLTGIYPLDAGTITLGGKTISGLPAHKIARAGIARTFQNIRLFNNLTVLENVMIGTHLSVQASVLGAVLGTRSLGKKEKEAHEKAMDLIGIFSKRLYPRLDHPVFSLSYANRRRVEIARALATNPQLLLLDEPTAGMNPNETLELADNVQEIKARGVTMAIIEHKLDVVNRISDRVAVLDFGKKIAEGSAAEVRNNPYVIEAYLGHSATTA